MRCCCRGAGPIGARRCGSSGRRRPTCLTVAAQHPTFPILLEATRECVNDVFDLPALRDGARRVAVARDPRRSRRHAAGVAVRAVAAVLVDLRLHVRGRHAARRAAGRRARARPRPAARPARRRRAARAARPRRARRPRARAAAPRRRTPSPRRRRAARPAAPARAADDHRARRPRHRRSDRVARPARATAAGHRGDGRRRGALRRRRRRGAAARRARRGAAGRPARGVHRSGRRPDARPRRPLCPHARAVPHRAGGEAPRRRRRRGCCPSLEALERDGRIVRGEFRPDGVEREWCDDDVLRQLRRRSLAALRKEVEPVDGERARPLPAGVARRRLEAGAASTGSSTCSACCRARRSPASVLEADVLPARVAEYRAADLDALCTSGDVVWVGAGGLGANDGRVRLVFRDQAPLLVPPPTEHRRRRRRTRRCSSTSSSGARRSGPSWCRRSRPPGVRYEEAEVLGALWDLVWAGHVTNDSLAPGAGHGRGQAGRGERRRRRHGRGPGPAGWRGSGRRRRRAAGRSSRRCSRPRRRPPRRRTRVPCSCSSATACSPARRRWPRASRAGSRACTRC